MRRVRVAFQVRYQVRGAAIRVHHVQLAFAAVARGGKGNKAAVGGPGGVFVGAGVRRQTADLGTRLVYQKDIHGVERRLTPGKYNPFPGGGPLRRVGPVKAAR